MVDTSLPQRGPRVFPATMRWEDVSYSTTNDTCSSNNEWLKTNYTHARISSNLFGSMLLNFTIGAAGALTRNRLLMAALPFGLADAWCLYKVDTLEYGQVAHGWYVPFRMWRYTQGGVYVTGDNKVVTVQPLLEVL